MNTTDHALLEAALFGYRHQRDQIDAKIAELRKEIGGKAPVAAKAPAPAGKKRQMSAAARKRIAAAQKKRWAEYHKLQESQSK
jgi:hypothetical protein